MTIAGHKTIRTCPQKNKSCIFTLRTISLTLKYLWNISKKCLKWFSGTFFCVFIIISSFTSKRRVALHDICKKILGSWILVSWKCSFCKRWCNSPNPMCFPWARWTLIFSNFTPVIKSFLCIGFFTLRKYILRIVSKLPYDKINSARFKQWA